MLHYTKSGSGSHILVLLHGFMENLTIWDDLEPHLSQDFTLIKMDLPGHGESLVEQDTSMESMAAAVKETLDHLEITKRIHMLGHSMGGYVSLAFAELFPERLETLTLFFSTYLADDEEKKQQRLKSLRVIRDAFPAYVTAGIPNLFNPNERDILEGAIKKAKEIALSTQQEGVIATLQARAQRKDRKETVMKFDRKILVLAGKHDQAIKVEETLAGLPDRTTIKSYLLDCAHNGHWEKPAVCAAIINTELLHHLPELVF